MSGDANTMARRNLRFGRTESSGCCMPCLLCLLAGVKEHGGVGLYFPDWKGQGEYTPVFPKGI
jgi:hypothetical protein